MNYQGKSGLNDWVASIKDRVKNAETKLAKKKHNDQIQSLVSTINEILDASGFRKEILAKLIVRKKPKPKTDEKVERAFLEAIGEGAFKASKIGKAVEKKIGTKIGGSTYWNARENLEAKGLIQRFGEKSGTVYILTDVGKAKLKS